VSPGPNSSSPSFLDGAPIHRTKASVSILVFFFPCDPPAVVRSEHGAIASHTIRRALSGCSLDTIAPSIYVCTGTRKRTVWRCMSLACVGTVYSKCSDDRRQRAQQATAASGSRQPKDRQTRYQCPPKKSKTLLVSMRGAFVVCLMPAPSYCKYSSIS
jgi:hypothetical protein